ncbi:MAG: flavodoxin family protein [Spirochaetes bacterium]|nr:flavodoxin family protein [Spirochaetota bacterium]
MSTPRYRALAINGSARKGGNTFRLLERVLQGLAKEGFHTELIELGGSVLRGCTACRSCFKNKNRRCVIETDSLNEIFSKMIDSDALIIGSPTYFADVTSETKALIDRAGYVARANDNLLARKVGAAVVMMRRAGAIHAFDTINHFFLIEGMYVAGSTYWNLGIGREIGEVEKDSEAFATMEALSANIAHLVKCLKREG